MENPPNTNQFGTNQFGTNQFGTNKFGTDGIRNKVGSSPFTIQDLPNLVQAISMWAKEKYQDGITVLIAQDTRNSCSWIKSILKTYLLINGIEIHDCEVLPISALFHFMKQEKKYKFAIMISASHNPYYDNGIKIIDGDRKISAEDESKITNYLNSIEKNNFKIDFTKTAQDKFLIDAKYKYVNLVTNLFKPNLLKDLKIVLDVANGATYDVAPLIFEKLGATVITLNNLPSGKNINENCGSTAPKNLQTSVINHNADIGFAYDGDGDRVIAVNSFGQIKDGDDILAILSNHSRYQNNKVVVGTIMSNKGLEDYLKTHKKQFIRSSVGDKHVLIEMQNNKTILGGEQSGHILLSDIINTCDAIIVSLTAIESMKENNNWSMETFEKYPQKLINLPIKAKNDLDAPPIKNLISSYERKLKNGRLLLRYSGTENYLRIMAESQNVDEIEPILSELIRNIQVYLS